MICVTGKNLRAGLGNFLAFSGVAAVALALAGCQAPAQPSGPTRVTLHLTDYETFVDDSLTLLRQYDFPPEFVDRTHGVIVSQPATSAQWFEPWRVDSRGGYQVIESSLHTMRRVVTVNVEPTDPATTQPVVVVSSADAGASAGEKPSAAPEFTAAGATVDETTAAPTAEASPATGTMLSTPSPITGSFRVTVRVDKFRLTQPERQVTSASGAMGMYSSRLPTTEGRRATPQDVQWVPLGRDALLEEWLAGELAKLGPARMANSE